MAGRFRPLMVAVVSGLVLASLLGSSVSAANSRSTLKNFQHVFVIMMENTGYDSLIGNPNAPWINAAAATDGLATNAYGVTHPSQPNYIAMTSGSTNGVADDNDITIDVPNIVDQLEAGGKTWNATTAVTVALHDQARSRLRQPALRAQAQPVRVVRDVQSNPARMANIVDSRQMSTDLATGNPQTSASSPRTSATTCTGAQAPQRPLRLLPGPIADRDRGRLLVEHCGP